jgi:ABC-type sugar transport system substrate-binding protein
LRALAARFAAFTDLLGMPGWADRWYLAEAQRHGVHGVVHLVAPDSRGSWFATQALEDAGIPVLEIDADNADAREWDEAAFVSALEQFIEQRVTRS